MREGGASVIVTGVLMTVDSHCSVTISSLSDPECSKPSPPSNEPKPSLTQTLPPSMTAGSDSTAAVIGGVVAIVLIIVVAIVVTIVVIAALVLKNRRLTTKTAEKLVQRKVATGFKYVNTCPIDGIRYAVNIHCE